MWWAFAVLVGLCGANEYQTHSRVPAVVNTIGPFNNPAESYKFYTLPFCPPNAEQDHEHNLGESLAGDRRTASAYDIRFKVDVQWQALCKAVLTAEEVNRFIEAIKQHYLFEMFVDELPVKGFVGEVETISSVFDVDELAHNSAHAHNESHVYLFTHLDFSFSYNGAHVIACNLTTDPEQRVELFPGKSKEVEFSFGIHWHQTNVAFDDRMAQHAKSLIQDQPIEIHWLSIINSFVLVVLLSAFLAVVFMRVLKKDFARYLELDETDFGDDEADTGWKLVHGDVFRFPAHPMLLSAAVGTGCQLFVLTVCILLLALLGVFYPGNRGAVYSAGIIIFAFTSGISGYISTSMYVQMGGEKWASSVVLTTCLFSVPFFLTFCVVNTMAIFYGSSSALPFGTIMIILLLWVLVQFPLTIVGAMRGRNPEPFTAPCKTNRARREIPPTPWYRSSWVVLPLSGFLPFSAIYIELHYIFVSIWGHRVYTLFEILALAFILLLLVTALISMALTYFQLVSEDYHWWWRSYLSGTSTGVFMYAYAVFYFYHRSEMSGVLQGTFFFGYVLMISYAFALMLGAVSFLVSSRFVRHIYGSIKVE